MGDQQWASYKEAHKQEAAAVVLIRTPGHGFEGRTQLLQLFNELSVCVNEERLWCGVCLLVLGQF